MLGIIKDVRFALRMLLKTPGYTVVAVLMLAFAIGANTAIFSAVNVLVLRPMRYVDPDELVFVVESRPDFDMHTAPYLNYLDYRARNSTFHTLAARGFRMMSVAGKGDAPESAEMIMLETQAHDFLAMLGVELALGRNFLPEEDAPHGPRAVILGHGLWTRRFAADPAILGREVALDGAAWTVVGVLPAEYPSILQPDAVIPLGTRADEPAFRDRGFHPELHLIGRLKPGVTLEQARADLAAIGAVIEQGHPDQFGASHPVVRPLHEELVQEHRTKMMLLFGAVICVLLIAAANVANLTLERAMSRQREMTIRAALGAGRGRLIRQMLVESVLLALLAGGLGLLLALWGIDLVRAAFPTGPVTSMLGSIEIDRPVLAFTLAVALGTGLLFGVAPAVFASRQDLAQALKNADLHASSGRRHLRARDLLVVVEVALTLVLAVGAVLATRSLDAVQRVDPGFDVDDVLAAPVPISPTRYPSVEDIRQFASEAQRRIATIPGVTAVTAASGLPPMATAFDTVYPPDVPRSPDNAKMALVNRVDVGYFELYEIPLLAGRTFAPEDRTGAPVVIIDQMLADAFFPGEDPIGKYVQERLSGQPSARVVGVVGHVKAFGLDAPDRTPYQLYYSYQQMSLAGLQDMLTLGTFVVLSIRVDREAEALIPQIQAKLGELDPLEKTHQVGPVAGFLETSTLPRQFATQVLALFAGVALLLATLGLYAVMASAVAQRTPELGVRIALGAQSREILALVVRHGMRLVGVGLLVGVVVALALARLMTALLTESVAATDPLTYIGVALILAVVGLLATLLPARRATRVDPMVALRRE